MTGFAPHPPPGASALGASDELKRAAAAEALKGVRSGMRLGLGTGSTAAHFVDLLGRALAEGRLGDIVGVPTSERTARQARELGIPLAELSQAQPLDLAVDGADEVDPALDLVKGLGGALLREKMIVQAARRFVVIADESKSVPRLGSRAPLPVEVVPFAWEAHLGPLGEMGGLPTLRTDRGGAPVRTDNGNFILDLAFEDGIGDPHELEGRLRARAGVVETGLFLGMAQQVVLAGSDGVRTEERGAP